MPGNCECVAILDPSDPRAEVWKQIVPALRIPLKHPKSHIATCGPEDAPVTKHFLEGDPSRLNDFQKAKYAELMAKHFGVQESEAFESLARGDLPVCSENTIIVICSMHTRMMIA